MDTVFSPHPAGTPLAVRAAKKKARQAARLPGRWWLAEVGGFGGGQQGQRKGQWLRNGGSMIQ